MTLTLAIVTCGPQLEVALRGPELPGTSLVRLAGRSPRSTLLVAAVDLLFEDAAVQPEALGRILVSRGPGSFTGIRAGLASAAGMAAATGAEAVAFDSLTTQAARCEGPAEVWAAQPGRRGEVYARKYALRPGHGPQPLGEIRIVSVADSHLIRPCVAAEALGLGDAVRAQSVRTAAEALLHLDDLDFDPDPMEPLYVEGPPVHRPVG